MITRRKWGWYLTLFRCPWLCIKILKFDANGRLSTQRHIHRNEWWLFLNGTSSVWTSDKISENGHIGAPCLCEFGDIKFIKRGTIHKIINNSTRPTYLLEIQYGKKVNEDDIERFKDWVREK